MFKFLSKGLNNNKGFTLVELLVVIAIIAIIALIAVPRLTGFTTTAKEAADEASAKTIENAVKMHMTENADYRGGTWGSPTTEGKVDVPDELKSYLGDTIDGPVQGGTWKVEVTGNNVTVEPAGSGS